MSSFFDDEIRPPDENYSDRLIGSGDDYDDELMMAIELSRNEFYGISDINNNIIQIEQPIPINEPPLSKKELKKLEKDRVKEELRLQKLREKEDIAREKERQKLEKIELLRKEKEDAELKAQLDKEEAQRLEKEEIERLAEEKRLDKERRILSLAAFSKKIKMLVHSKDDVPIKNFMEETLEKYFDGTIEHIIIRDIKLYTSVYNFIDSYYKIPLSKNRVGSISEKEDSILRKIFLKE
jgi:hypothetical protein